MKKENHSWSIQHCLSRIIPWQLKPNIVYITYSNIHAIMDLY